VEIFKSSIKLLARLYDDFISFRCNEFEKLRKIQSQYII